jgi:hypothetical protein|tara:strand:- start:102 stop:557 length:456 start_codon:yes stop_codon:yes gene_type:complete
MKNRFFGLILIFIFLNGCGYQAIYSQKDSPKIHIKTINLEGDKKINRKILLLTNLKNQNSGSPPYNLKLNSSKNVKVIAKDNSGKATIYRTTITVFFSLEFKNEIYKQKKFESNTSYNNMENSFDLSQYQKTIEGNLINKIAQEITIFIST